MNLILSCCVCVFLFAFVICQIKDPSGDIQTDGTTIEDTTVTETIQDSTTTIEVTTVIHGNWGEWGPWTSCSVHCGTGTRYRDRVCDNPPPGENGDDCDGSTEGLEACNLGECCAPKVFDIVFLIDVTDYSRFSNVKALFNEITDLFSISPTATRISTVLSSSTTSILFGFNKYSSASAIKSAINGISTSSATSNPKSALEFIRSDVLTEGNGARSDISDVVIMYVTHDSYSYNSFFGWFIKIFIDDEPKEAAQKLKDNGVYLLVAEGNSQSEFGSIANVYESFSTFTAGEKNNFLGKIQSGFPCNYFCGTSVFALDSPENLGSGNDSSSGYLYLMTDSAYQMTCCGATSVWEFYAVNHGVVEVMIFRNTGRYSYYLVGSTRIVVPEAYVGKTVSFNLLASERVAFVEGDFLGWHTSAANIIGHADCTGDNCPQNNKMLRISRDTFVDGDTLNFVNATTVPNRGYSLKLAATDNTELHIIPIQNETEVEENTPVGFKVMYFRVTDTDLADNITMSLTGVNSHYFAMGSVQYELATMTLEQKLPEGPSGPYILTVIGQDSCRHSASTTVTVLTYNAPPVVHNLPHIMEISETVKEPMFLYSLNVSDFTNDPICCTMPYTLPHTLNFRIKYENGVYSLWTSDNPAFSYGDVDSYRLFVCCQDNFNGSSVGYLIIRLKETKTVTTYTPPGWFTRAIVVSMLPISVMTILTFAILIITMFCLDATQDIEDGRHSIEAEFETNDVLPPTLESRMETDIKTLSKPSDSFIIEREKTEVNKKSKGDTIYFKNMYTDEEFFIPVWRSRNVNKVSDIPQNITQTMLHDDVAQDLNENSEIDISTSQDLGSKSRTEFGVEMNLFHYGRKPMIKKPDRERAIAIFQKKNEIKEKWQETIAKAEQVKKQKQLLKKLMESKIEQTDTNNMELMDSNDQIKTTQNSLDLSDHVEAQISVDSVNPEEPIYETEDLSCKVILERSQSVISAVFSDNDDNLRTSSHDNAITNVDDVHDEEIISVFDEIIDAGNAPLGTQ